MPNVIAVFQGRIKQFGSRRMRWVRHVARIGERIVCRVLVGKPEEENHLDDLGEDGRIILRWIFRKLDGGMD